MNIWGEEVQQGEPANKEHKLKKMKNEMNELTVDVEDQGGVTGEAKVSVHIGEHANMETKRVLVILSNIHCGVGGQANKSQYWPCGANKHVDIAENEVA